MKTLATLLATLIAIAAALPSEAAPPRRHDRPARERSERPHRARDGWRLVWADEFDGDAPDTASWNRCEAGDADWMRHMSPLDSLCRVEDGVLKLRGIRTPRALGDPRPCITGGVDSRGKRSLRTGRIDVRARFDCAQGFWPAIWLMPDSDTGWPRGGEIDIMEHLNGDTIVYQTVHTPLTLRGGGNYPPQSATAPVDPAQFNVYSVVLSPHRIEFFVNGRPTHSYPRLLPDREDQFPFKDHAFYVILSAQLGGSWVGEIDFDSLPVEMEVDYVRFYEKRGR